MITADATNDIPGEKERASSAVGKPSSRNGELYILQVLSADILRGVRALTYRRSRVAFVAFTMQTSGLLPLSADGGICTRHAQAKNVHERDQGRLAGLQTEHASHNQDCAGAEPVKPAGGSFKVK